MEAVLARLAPATPLARIQSAWPQVVGPMIAREAQPVAERDGVVVVACRSAVWAQELDLMSTDVVARLNEALGGEAVKGLRCRAC